MMVIGALVLVCGGSYAIYDYSRAGSVETGESCGNTEHCKTGACIHAGSDFTGVCANECGSNGTCDAGYACHQVDYQAAGTTVEGYAGYCLPDPS